MSSRPHVPLLRLGMATGVAAALLFATEPLQAQGAPGSRPPATRPWHGHDRSNIPPRPRPVPPHGHDRSNIPPRANPDTPGQGTPHGPSDPVGPAEPGSRGEANGRDRGNNGRRESVSPAGLSAALAAGELTLPSGQAIPAGAQRALLSLIEGNRPGADRAVAAALSPTENGEARGEAARLAGDLEGLLQRPDGLHQAVLSYNALVDASSEAFLRSPSAEFLATQSVLAVLVDDAFAVGPER